MGVRFSLFETSPRGVRGTAAVVIIFLLVGLTFEEKYRGLTERASSWLAFLEVEL